MSVMLYDCSVCIGMSMDLFGLCVCTLFVD